MTLVCVARCNDPVVLAGLWHGVPFALIATVTGRKSFMVAGDLHLVARFEFLKPLSTSTMLPSIKHWTEMR
jgi:hypothetical protein